MLHKQVKNQSKITDFLLTLCAHKKVHTYVHIKVLYVVFKVCFSNPNFLLVQGPNCPAGFDYYRVFTVV